MQGGLPDTSGTRTFAEQLYARIPRASGKPAVSSYAQQERAKAVLASRNRQYALLEASDEEDEAPVMAPQPTTVALPKEDKKKKKHLRTSKARPLSPFSLSHVFIYTQMGRLDITSAPTICHVSGVWNPWTHSRQLAG